MMQIVLGFFRKKRVTTGVETINTKDPIMNIYIAKTQNSTLGIGYFTGANATQARAKAHALGYVGVSIALIVKDASARDLLDYLTK